MVRMDSCSADDVTSDGETNAVRRPPSSAAGREWTLQDYEVYLGYGDGSANSMGSFYGIVLIPEKSISMVEDEIAAIKVGFGGARESRIHCREIFHKIARTKSEWLHLVESDIIAMCVQICSVLDRFRSKCLLAYMPRDRFPKKLRLKGKGDAWPLVHRLDEKWLTLWAFFQAGSRLDPVELIAPEPPPDGPCGLPYRGMLVRRVGPGPKVRMVHLDRETTRVQWLSEAIPWDVAARKLTIETARGTTQLPIAPEATSQPMLVDVADLVTYAFARAIAGTDPILYRHSLGGLDTKIIVGSADDIHLE